ncbi:MULTISPECIES: fumarylacetoacetate hydrolase family protein [Chelativorans]|uniref:Fumarylacetoacetate (FAA) hydrolase n=1 Tax=Chelativorans sp. (strain BNC1) TaxID=266779 RepID=Q11E65_CHESB
MTDLKLVSYSGPRGIRTAAVKADRYVDAADVTGVAAHASMPGLLADWAAAERPLQAAFAAGQAMVGLPKLVAPLPLPGAIYCIGANYADHIAEMQGGGTNGASVAAERKQQKEDGLKPWFFIKSSHSVCGPETKVALPATSKKVDWEAELAVVIGRKSRDLTIENALTAVWGYTIANDLSARDLSRRPPLPQGSPFFFDWTSHKSFDDSCPMGPWIVSASQIVDANDLDIGLSINGQPMQKSNTSQMIFTVAEQVAHLSQRITLWPGDIILTGTPAGVGAGRNLSLKPSDEVSVYIEGIGELRHSIA